MERPEGRQLWGAHASRVLVSASRRNELVEPLEVCTFALQITHCKSSSRRDAATSTRDACAPQNCSIAIKT